MSLFFKKFSIHQFFIIFLLLLLPRFASAQQDYSWYKPTYVGGVCEQDTVNIFHRLPAVLKKQVRQPVWDLSLNTAGEYIDFSTDAENITVKYVVDGSLAMPHMPTTGVSGVALWAMDRDGLWKWAPGTYHFGDTITYKFQNLVFSKNGQGNFRLYLPLYNTVRWLTIGIKNGKKFSFAPKSVDKPIVAYGTSILQGAVASRPDLAWTNILSRALDQTVINLGFSGNGRIEAPIINLMSTVDAKLYIIDCMPNLTKGYGITDQDISQRISYAVNKLREKNKTVPILFADHSGGYAADYLDTARANSYKQSSQLLNTIFNQLKSSGVENIYLLTDKEINFDAISTTEGLHPNDIGMLKYADAYETKIRQILNEPKGQKQTLAAKEQSRDKTLAPTPPMGFMSWNYFADKVNEKDLKEIADAMVTSGMVAAGYNYIFIDDCWQGGRDSKNNMIADPIKFPSGIKALADYLHKKGMKLGIYSDAATLTCAGYTASLNFEEKDAKTFAAWGVDYLKYDYCGAPSDMTTAQQRYAKMATALRHSGRDIAFGICEWGQRQPWLWAANAGGQLWRVSGDVRDKWIAINPDNKPVDNLGWGIMDIVNRDADLALYAGPGHWNDPDMLVVGLYGKKGPSGDLGGVGCSDAEYRSQMSLWCLMAAPLMVTCDVRSMNETTKSILCNKDLLAIDQDALGKQATRKINNDNWNVFVKPLSNGDYAVGVLNLSGKKQSIKISLDSLALTGKFNAYDVWSKKTSKNLKTLNLVVDPHETKVIRLSK